jgi:hypothetical protein
MRSTGLPKLTFLGLAAALSLPVAAGSARAQSIEEEMAQEEGGDASAGSATGGSAAPTPTGDHHLSDEQAVYEERTSEGPVPSETDPRERPNTDYFFLGAFARGVIVPTFIQGAFVQYEGGVGATGEPVNMGAGAQFTWRRNGFGVMAEVWYLGFGHAGYYHGLGAADTEFELVESNLGAVFGNFVFDWSIDVTDWFAFEIGFGLGFGGMVGNLYRTEAYRDSATGQLNRCRGPNSPPTAGGYCEGPVELRGSGGRLDDTRMRGGTYQRTGDPTIDGLPNNGPNPWYFGDGGVPPMFFWLDLPRIGLRFKPIHQIQIRVDGGYNLYGFNFGGSIAYGF